MKLTRVTDMSTINPQGKKVLLFSGGVDSYCISELWNPDILLYVDMHLKYNETEMQKLKRLPINKEVLVVDLPIGMLGEKSTFVPNRNLFLLTIASEFGDKICLGTVIGDRASDTTIKFMQMAGEILTQTHTGQPEYKDRVITIENKYKNYTKAALLKECQEKGISLQELWYNTYSCYQDKVCWNCRACFRKALAFMQVGYKLPTGAVKGLQSYIKNNDSAIKAGVESEDEINLIEDILNS